MLSDELIWRETADGKVGVQAVRSGLLDTAALDRAPGERAASMSATGAPLAADAVALLSGRFAATPIPAPRIATVAIPRAVSLLVFICGPYCN
jgi:hypothetical protein